MMKYLLNLCVLFVTLVMIFGGCSGGRDLHSAQSPSEPPIPSLPGDSGEILLPEQDNNATDGMLQFPSHHLLAYYIFRVNPRNQEIEPIPIRIAAKHLNVLGYLQNFNCPGNPGEKCIYFEYDWSELGYLNLTAYFTHPFKTTEYMGFDVRGIAIFPGNNWFYHEIPDPDPDNPTPTPVNLLFSDNSITTPPAPELENAEGYTTLYNPLTKEIAGIPAEEKYIQGDEATLIPPWNGILNGFLRYNENVGERNVFRNADTHSRLFKIKLIPGAFNFGYAVDASWALYSTWPDAPEDYYDFPPGANCKEPWKIEVDQNPEEWGLTDVGGIVHLLITVYDWQGFDTHKGVFVECHQLFGSQDEPSIAATLFIDDKWGVPIENEKLAPPGIYKCLIFIEDNTNDPVNKPWLDITAYQIIDLEVRDSSELPPYSLISFDVSRFSDPDNPGAPDPDLDYGQIKLDWEVQYPAPNQWYLIERRTLNGGWQWAHSELDPYETSWIDDSPAINRLSGEGYVSYRKSPKTYESYPIRYFYRINARKPNPHFPPEPPEYLETSWLEDSGWPRFRRVGVALWGIDGKPDETYWPLAEYRYDIASLFWKRYGIELVLHNPGNTLYKIPSDIKDQDILYDCDDIKTSHTFNLIHSGYNTVDYIDIYFVNSILINNKLWNGCAIPLPYSYDDNTANNSAAFVTLVDPDGNHDKRTFSHELAHIVGQMVDEYQLDADYNDIRELTCNNVGGVYWTPEGPWYCDEGACYPQANFPPPWKITPFNLMWHNYSTNTFAYDFYEGQFLFISGNVEEPDWDTRFPPP